MTWYTSKKRFESESTSTARLTDNLKVVASHFGVPEYNGFSRTLYLSSPKEDRDYILLIEICDILHVKEKYPVFVEVLSTNKETPDFIINKFSENVEAINQKKPLEARV